MLTITLECYGWVALALPVYANVSWDPERPLNKPAHTGRASATQPRVCRGGSGSLHYLSGPHPIAPRRVRPGGSKVCEDRTS